jgi:hypothetical protein
MNMKTGKTNTVHFFATMLGSLVCLCPSCDEVGNRAPSETLSATLSVSCRPFGADNEALARSAGRRNRAPETVEIPLEDRWFLAATLEEEEVAPTRADYNGITDGAKFVVVAYEISSGSSQSAMYTYNAALGQLEKSVATQAIELTTGEKYRYVHYSYNSTTEVPVYGATINVTPYSGTATNNDLLWGEGGGENGLGTDEAIEVSLSHKFTRVKLKISSSETTSANLSITSAAIETNYSDVLTVADGSFLNHTLTTAQEFSLTGAQVSTSHFVESEYRMVHAANQPVVKVRIVGTIGNKPFDLTPTFTGPLAAGGSYVLRIRFRKGVGWAGSNVYWDQSLNGGNGSLTFAPHGDRTKEMYQGVFFKWGSLVGIDPSRYNGSTDWNSSNSILYIPNYTSASVHSWTTDVHMVYNNIPSLYAESIIEQGIMDRYYLALYSDYANQKGDICRYLSESEGYGGGIGIVKGKYRMPTLCELVKGNNNGGVISGSDYGPIPAGSDGIGKWTRIGSNVSSDWFNITDTNPDGTYANFTTGANYDGYAGFPTAGGRNSYSYGSLNNVGVYGFYWSSSASSTTDFASYWYFTRDAMYIANDGRRAAYPVRCILDEE